jgi:hypothetical protein
MWLVYAALCLQVNDGEKYAISAIIDLISVCEGGIVTLKWHIIAMLITVKLVLFCVHIFVFLCEVEG